MDISKARISIIPNGEQLNFDMNTSSKASNNMIPNSEHQDIGRASPSQFNSHLGNRKPELLELITNFCWMQASVVTMVISSLILDNLSNLLMLDRSNGQDKTTNTILTFPNPCDIQLSDGGDTLPPQVEPVPVCVRDVKVARATSSQCCRGVTPGTRSQIVFTKVFEMNI